MFGVHGTRCVLEPLARDLGRSRRPAWDSVPASSEGTWLWFGSLLPEPR